MNTKLQIEQEIAEFTRKLETSKKSLEEFNQNDVMGCKPGDYIICIDNDVSDKDLILGQIYILERVTNLGDRLQVKSCLFYPYRFRKATISEIDAHLINEAAAQGFVIGAKIIDGKYISSIDHIDVYRGGAHPRERKCISLVVTEEYKITGKPVVFASYNNDTYGTPISQLKLAPTLPDIKIEVGGTVYTAEFHPGYVQFGCAKIDNVVFIESEKFLSIPMEHDLPGNRNITAIQIGKGLFTNKLIREIAARIKEKV